MSLDDIAGHALVQIKRDGTVNVEIEGLHYMQLYGIAHTLDGMARKQQMDVMLSEDLRSGQLMRAAGLPAGLPKPGQQ